MKLTFTVEAIAAMDPTRLGELVQDRVKRGARRIEVVPLDEAIGRLTAMGVAAEIRDRPALEVEAEDCGHGRSAHGATGCLAPGCPCLVTYDGGRATKEMHDAE